MNHNRKAIVYLAFTALALPSIAVGWGGAKAEVIEAPPAIGFAHDAFANLWNRTDRPVSLGQVSRSWYWGPSPNSDGLLEDYAEGAGHKRLVQYFDKSRMELNDPNGNPSDPFFVTNGLLTIELISGRMQVGNAAYQQRAPASIPLASDNDDPNAPTYLSFQSVSNTTLGDHPAPSKIGQFATATINKAGQVGNDPSKASIPGTELVYFQVGTFHNIPLAIRAFLLQTGPVYDAATGKNVTAPLSNPWFYTTGYPISEPYWAKVKIANQPNVDVMIQAFERRVVTYVPSAPAGFQVQMSNIGQHYYDWRYGTVTPPTAPTVVPGQHTIDQFVGTWLTSGEGTGRARDEVAKLWITRSGNNLAVRWFAKCDVSLCDKGQKVVPYAGDPVKITLGEYAFSFSLSGVPGQFQLNAKYHDDIGDEDLYFKPTKHTYYSGVWLNNDASTTSVAKLWIEAGNPRPYLTVKWFAACGTSLCEKEEKTQTYSGEPFEISLNSDSFQISLDNINSTRLKVTYRNEVVLYFHKVQLPDYNGTWGNVDPNTKNIVRFVITTSINPSVMNIHWFGACTPSPCDNGTMSAPVTAEPLVLKSSTGLAKTFTITFDNAGGSRLKVHVTGSGQDLIAVLQKQP